MCICKLSKGKIQIYIHLSKTANGKLNFVIKKKDFFYITIRVRLFSKQFC